MSSFRRAILGRNIKRLELGMPQENFAPVKWSQYFTSKGTVTTKSGTFHYYKRGDSGPAIICLHGGGYSGLTWALFAVEITAFIECHVIAIDLRGHGGTTTNDDSDLSLNTLAKDVDEVVNALLGKNGCPIVLVGHSMGGAVAVEASYILKGTIALSVIDVVEGTALDALSSMQSILRGRPSQFKSVQHAIQWCYKGGQTNNIDAAKVSMPGQIVSVNTGKLAADDIDNVELLTAATVSSPIKKKVVTASASSIPEVDETNCSDCGKPPLPKSAKTMSAPAAPVDEFKYKWRIDLSKTESFWPGWFKGLSQKFLDAPLPKLLLLANIHGLDTTLTVGQMQGKFQLQVLPKSGHAIHEDLPGNVAELLGGYLFKQKLATAKVDLTASVPGC